MKNIQKTQVIHNSETYHGHIFFPEENITQHWKDIRFRDCSFRGDITIGSMENCHFENCSFSGSVGVRLQFLASEKIPEWCLSLPHIDKLKIYDPHITSLPANIDKLEKLVQLDVSGCSALRMLNGIETLRDLRSLSLQECRSISDILPQSIALVTELNLRGIGSDFQFLYEMKNVKKLYLSKVLLNNLDMLSNMKNLSHLEVSLGSLVYNVNALQHLLNLQFLDLSNLRGGYDLDVLFFLTKLEHLDISSTETRKLNLNLPRLKVLKLHFCLTLKDINLHCDELRYLTIRACHSLDNFDFYKNLRNLRYLDANYCITQSKCKLFIHPRIETCDILDNESISQVVNTEKLENLKKLHVGCNRLDDFDFSKLPRLRNLQLGKVYLEDEKKISKMLQSVDLEYLDVDGRVSGIDCLTNLRELCLRYCTLDDFSYLPSSVKSVYLHHCNFINPSIFESWSHIHSLHIESGSTEAYFRVISKFEKLTTLSICGGTMVDLHGLRDNKNIATLKLKSCHNLSNVEALKTLESLCHLSIDFCPQIDFTCIRQLHNLRKLTLRNIHTEIYGLENLCCTDISVSMD